MGLIKNFKDLIGTLNDGVIGTGGINGIGNRNINNII